MNPSGENRKREYSVLLPLDIAEKLQYAIQLNPYIDIVEIMDELKYAIAHKMLNQYLYKDE